jgi:hypothetical protein
MTLYHHDSRDYDVAASEAARKARANMERQIERGRASAVRVLEQIDSQVPADRIVAGQAVDFVPVGNGVELLVSKELRQTIHPHALDQFADRAAIPLRLVRSLQDMATDELQTVTTDAAAGRPLWAAELLAHNLREMYQKGPGRDKRYLMRSVNDQARGWLSDRYRRLDSRPLVQAFVEAGADFGAVPMRGFALATKVGLRLMLPMVFEPVPNEVLTFFLDWGNSDFGQGKNALRGGINRLWCTNECTTQDLLSQVHLGKRLDQNFAFSERTYELDTEASASAIKDMVTHALAPEQVHHTLAGIKAAHEEEVSPTQVSGFMKRWLTKGEAKEATDSFNSPDIINLPPGQSKWRLSNCISLLARDLDDEYRSLELQQIAGKALN